jgi:hypothetical protein
MVKECMDIREEPAAVTLRPSVRHVLILAL